MNMIFPTPLAIWGKKIITPERVLEDHTIILENNKIKNIFPGKDERVPRDRLLEIIDGWIAPGFIDIHTHGGFGHDAMDSTGNALKEISRFLARHGVTSFMPTTMAGPEDAVWESIENCSNYVPIPDGANILGVHVESPFISSRFRGTQPVEQLRNPSKEEYQAWFDSGILRLVTIAPELPGAMEFIREGRSRGVRFAAGHTNATYEQMLVAIDAGLDQATHIFNGMPSLHHREPGPVGAALADDRIYAQLIPDGIHIHPAVMKIIIRAKGISRTILISDANRGAGMPDGTYSLGSVRVHIKDGIARNDDGGLAGSTVSLDLGIRNVMKAANMKLPEVVPMVTSTPAEAMGIEDHKGHIAPGYDADIVVLDDEGFVKLTMIQGTIVFQNK